MLQIWEWKLKVSLMASSQMLCSRSCTPCPVGHWSAMLVSDACSTHVGLSPLDVQQAGLQAILDAFRTCHSWPSVPLPSRTALQGLTADPGIIPKYLPYQHAAGLQDHTRHQTQRRVLANMLAPSCLSRAQ